MVQLCDESGCVVIVRTLNSSVDVLDRKTRLLDFVCCVSVLETYENSICVFDQVPEGLKPYLPFLALGSSFPAAPRNPDDGLSP